MRATTINKLRSTIGMTVVALTAFAPYASAFTGTLGPVSEEYWKQNAECATASAPDNVGMNSFACFGSYCDDLYFNCASLPPGVTLDWTQWNWTRFVSDEGSPQAFCNTQNQQSANMIATGVQCSGRYCDNVSLQCTKPNSPLRNCGWMGPYSDETVSWADFGGKFVAGVQCSGSYCDNMKFFVCGF